LSGNCHAKDKNDRCRQDKCGVLPEFNPVAQSSVEDRNGKRHRVIDRKREQVLTETNSFVFRAQLLTHHEQQQQKSEVNKDAVETMDLFVVEPGKSLTLFV